MVRWPQSGFCAPSHTAPSVAYVGWRTELFASGIHSLGGSTGLPWHRRSQMNKQVEHLKSIRHLATQAGCCHWAPIVPRLADMPDGPKERPVTTTPCLSKSAAQPVTKKPD